jgi:hypothetical protein
MDLCQSFTMELWFALFMYGLLSLAVNDLRIHRFAVELDRSDLTTKDPSGGVSTYEPEESSRQSTPAGS